MLNDEETARSTFLIQMYGQMWQNIERHVLVVWESVGLLLASVTLLALVENGALPIDWAISLIVTVAGWVVAHVYDASFWFNRNIWIIGNIERQFLRETDAREIHYFIEDRRISEKVIPHLRLQYGLGVAVGSLALAYHFFKRVEPGVGTSWDRFSWTATFPYVMAGAISVLVPCAGSSVTHPNS